MTLSEYLKDPCAALSIPYWKQQNLTLPSGLCVINDRDFNSTQYKDYSDEQYFRLYHPLTEVKTVEDNGFSIKTADFNDIYIIMDIINRSYNDLAVSRSQLEAYMHEPTYRPELWILLRDTVNNEYAACGIADLDEPSGELSLEWIQVLPEYRRRHAGQTVVCELLRRGSALADFATVSGKRNDRSEPEKFYRSCGFTGDNVWHILRK